MNDYCTVNILDMIEAIGEDTLVGILSDFSCPLNPEIETFVKKNAIDFAKKKISITYLVLDNAEDILSIFALTHKALYVSCDGMTKRSKARLERYAQFDKDSCTYLGSAFLIAQFGMNDAVPRPTDWNGTRLMEKTFEVLGSVQKEIGGGIVYLECEDKPKLLDFYQNEKNGFHKFSERYSEKENINYIQLVRMF